MDGLKASWQVLVGLAPPPRDPTEEWTLGQPELCRAWHYTSKDYAADQVNCEAEPDNPDVNTKWKQYEQEAQEYAAQMRHPSGTNFVRLDWIWY